MYSFWVPRLVSHVEVSAHKADPRPERRPLPKEPDGGVALVRIDVGKEHDVIPQSQGEDDDVTMINDVPAIAGTQASEAFVKIDGNAGRKRIGRRGPDDAPPFRVHGCANHSLPFHRMGGGGGTDVVPRGLLNKQQIVLITQIREQRVHIPVITVYILTKYT